VLILEVIITRYFHAIPASNASAYAAGWNTAFDPDGLGGDYGT